VAEQPQTWHYGLIASYWAQFNDDFRPHEIPYFERFIADDGQPALDVACGHGRLLLPYLRSGLDVDGCDVSADMVGICRDRAEAEGFSPTLRVQPMHELDMPRRYRTIYVCGAFGLGSTREQDRLALERLRDHLEPGGRLLVDIEVPYADTEQWPLWTKEGRAEMPTTLEPPEKGRAAPDGAEYGLRSRYVEFDPVEQRVTLEMIARRWRDGQLEAEETRTLDINLYFKNELLLMLERAGFGDVVVHGDHVDARPTADDDFVVFVATQSA
jgi:SAM-dependent methyltransferase